MRPAALDGAWRLACTTAAPAAPAATHAHVPPPPSLLAELMASPDTIPAAIRQLRSSSRVAQLRAAQMLEELAAEGGEAAAEAIVAAGGIPALLGLLGSGSSQAAQQAALRTLDCVTDGHSTACAVLLSAGGLPRLVQLLRYSSEAQLTNARLASGVLCMLSLNGGRGHQAAIVAAGAAPALVSLLCQPHLPAQVSATTTIGCLTCHPHATTVAAFIQAGAVLPLVQCLASSDAMLLGVATGALANLTACKGLTGASLEAAQAGALPRLVQLLNGNEELQKSAALVLGNIVSDLQHQWQQLRPLKATFVAAGAVPATARLLSQQDSEVQSAAAAVACFLAYNDAACAADCVAAGMVPSLQRLLASSSPMYASLPLARFSCWLSIPWRQLLW